MDTIRRLQERASAERERIPPFVRGPEDAVHYDATELANVAMETRRLDPAEAIELEIGPPDPPQASAA